MLSHWTSPYLFPSSYFVIWGHKCHLWFFSKMDLHFCPRSLIFVSFERKSIRYFWIIQTWIWKTHSGGFQKMAIITGGSRMVKDVNEPTRKENWVKIQQEPFQNRFNGLCALERHSEEVEKMWTLVSDWSRLKLQLSQSFVMWSKLSHLRALVQ